MPDADVINRALEIKIVPIEDIHPNPDNRNDHPAEQIERLVQIIRYQGFRSPLIVSKRTGLLVAGHGRLEAAKALLLRTVPVIYQDFDSADQERACNVSDNAIALWAVLDLAGINEDLKDFDGIDFNLDLLGIKDFVVDMAEKGTGDPDDVPPVPAVAKTKRGELWLLDPYYVCESCKKEYPYDVGKAMSECACG